MLIKFKCEGQFILFYRDFCDNDKLHRSSIPGQACFYYDFHQCHNNAKNIDPRKKEEENNEEGEEIKEFTPYAQYVRGKK